jgi:hypothetical protein
LWLADWSENFAQSVANHSKHLRINRNVLALLLGNLSNSFAQAGKCKSRMTLLIVGIAKEQDFLERSECLKLSALTIAVEKCLSLAMSRMRISKCVVRIERR